MNYGQNVDPTKLKPGANRRILAVVIAGIAICALVFAFLIEAGEQTTVRVLVPPGVAVSMNGKVISPCGLLKSDCEAKKARAKLRETTYQWFGNANQDNVLSVALGSATAKQSFRAEAPEIAFTVLNQNGDLVIRPEH